jgi:hypothetical protein
MENIMSVIVNKLVFPPACFTGMGLCHNVLRDIVGYLKTGNIKKIVEFGSGSSTEFLLTFKEMYNLEFSVESYDHMLFEGLMPILERNGSTLDVANHNIISNSINFVFKDRHLVQYTDEEYSQIMNGSDFPQGEDLAEKEHDNFRSKNVFYNIKKDDLEGYYDMVILDGPNGNGRSIAFRHLVNKIRTGTKIIIDDYHHYPFIEDCKKFLNVNIIKQINLPDFHRLHGYAILEVV